jgi:hypothetical protein
MSRSTRFQHYTRTNTPQKPKRETLQQATIRIRKMFTKDMQRKGYIPGGPIMSIWLFDNGDYRGTVNAENASDARANIKRLLNIKSTAGFTLTRQAEIYVSLNDAHAPQ